MRILLVVRHFTYARNFESVLRQLAGDGHQVHVAAERDESFGGREMLDRLAAEYPSITVGETPGRSDVWADVLTRIRRTLDYLRYLDPAYDTAPKLRARAGERVPRLLLRVAHLPGLRSSGGRRRLARLLTALEQGVPDDPAFEAFLSAWRPDAVLLTPLLGVEASAQLDVLRAAMRLGIPTGLCVWSWDHLSSKALIRTVPDRVFVWNDVQRREAVELHGVPDERVVVTGAQCFDRWFDRRPARPRADFCRRVGLRDARPFLLWVCSALFKGSPVEAAFVERWVRTLRASGQPNLRDVNVLVRPHPSRMAEWASVDVGALEGVALWGANPVDVEARADYFDSLYHSAAVVGLNTSAFIEGAIVGRQVYTVLLPEYVDNQEGTIHFHYLLDVAGGLLHASRSLEAHAAQLEAVLRDPEGVDDRSRAFVEAFVRPQGLASASTPRFAAAVADLARLRPAPWAPPVPRGARTGARLLAAVLRGPGRRLLRNGREQLEADLIAVASERKETAKGEALARKQTQRDEKARARAARYRDKRRRTRRAVRERLVAAVRARVGWQ
jgi:hypothetical protein